MIEGVIVKLVIQAFADKKFEKRLIGRVFVAQVNPESFSLRSKANLRKDNQPAGKQGNDVTFNSNEPRELQLRFLLDGTGAIPVQSSRILPPIPDIPIAGEIADLELHKGLVLAQLAWFKRIVFDINGAIHEPHYLKITWGFALRTFRCRLENMNVEYKMFSPEGFPLRAMVEANFVEVTDSVTEGQITPRESTDITHQRIVREGDTLPILAREIYNDERFYVAVAQANKNIQFRNLRPGTEILFPSVSKE